jgi:arabinogalactan oligomer/maltooligosaccharide transport system substrate-binding protein
MKKNLFTLLSVLVLTSLVLSACGPAATPAPAPAPTQPPAAQPTQAPAAQPTQAPAPTKAPEPTKAPAAVKLTLWTKEASNQLDKLKGIVNDFQTKNPGITVEVVNYDVEKLRENFQTSMLANQGPDLLWTVNDHAGPFTKAGLIQPVDGLGWDLKSFMPGALEAVKLDGKAWGIPLSYGNNLMLLYNKNMVKDPPKDTDALIKVSKDLAASGKQGFAYNLNEPFWLVPWLGGFGGKVFDDTGIKPTLNTDAMKKTLQFVQDLKFKDQIVPKECDYGCADTLFKDGKAAMIINGDWSLGDYTTVTATKTIDLGTAPIPQITGADWPKPYTAGTYIMFPVSLKGDKLEAAKKLVNYFISDDVQISWVKSDKRLPGVAKLYTDKLITDDPILKGSSADLANGTGMPPQAEMRCVWDAMRPNLEAVMANKMTPADAAAAMQTAADKCVAELK